MVKQSSVTTKMPAVFRGKKCVIHGCLSKKASSSARSAASSNTITRYKSEIAIAIQASNGQPQKTDIIPIVETRQRVTMRKISLLVSLHIESNSAALLFPAADITLHHIRNSVAYLVASS